MRYEQIIAAVARRLAIAEVREITVVESFAVALRLHLWRLRMSLGMPSYSGSDMTSPNAVAMKSTVKLGSKRGTWQPRLALVKASCPVGTASA